jgi:hypothetical protein
MKITANRSDEEPDRITRLEEVRDALSAKGIRAVKALHDHKGTLYVDWSSTPSTEQLVIVIKIWEDLHEPHSNHVVNGRPLVWDVGGTNPFGGPNFP